MLYKIVSYFHGCKAIKKHNNPRESRRTTEGRCPAPWCDVTAGSAPWCDVTASPAPVAASRTDAAARLSGAVRSYRYGGTPLARRIKWIKCNMATGGKQ